MNKNEIREIIRDRIYRLNGKPFQQLCWDVFIKIFPDLQTPRPVHDLGNDGYTIKASKFFACYAPEGHEYDNKETITKIDDDYKKFLANWKDRYDFKKWVFLTKDNLTGAPHQKLVELNGNGDGITKENWGIEQIVNTVMSLDEAVIKMLFNLEEATTPQSIINHGIINSENTSIGKQANVINEYHNYAGQEQEENTAIEDVFNYVISQLPKTPEPQPSDDTLIKVREKIKLNFTEHNDQGEVEKYFNQAYTRTRLIEERLQALEPQIQSDIETHIFQKYAEFKRSCKTNMEILDKLFDFFTPAKKKLDSAYAGAVRAFVLLFFEDCTIFEKK